MELVHKILNLPLFIVTYIFGCFISAAVFIEGALLTLMIELPGLTVIIQVLIIYLLVMFGVI